MNRHKHKRERENGNLWLPPTRPNTLQSKFTQLANNIPTISLRSLIQKSAFLSSSFSSAFSFPVNWTTVRALLYFRYPTRAMGCTFDNKCKTRKKTTNQQQKRSNLEENKFGSQNPN